MFKNAASQAVADVPATLASAVYGRLRHDVLLGELKPGEKLRIETLRERYSAGASPIREALNRLTSDGLVVQEDQKGFRVSPVSMTELMELTKARLWVTELALRQSIANGDPAWEEQILLSFHRMARAIGQAKDDFSEAPDDIERLHRDFHSSLIAACGSRWITGFADTLFDLARRYQRLSMLGTTRRKGAEREHRAIMDAVLARDADLAVKLHNEHIGRTVDIITKLKLVPERR